MHRILVIDDEKAILDVVQIALTRAGFGVETAADGHKGIQKFDEGHFDVVITDMLMPGVNGQGVVQHIRNSARSSTPIIGFSGTPWFLSSSDFDVVLTKPFPLKDLVDATQDLSAKPLKANIRQ
jgi:two-component system response regulator TrcR